MYMQLYNIFDSSIKNIFLIQSLHLKMHTHRSESKDLGGGNTLEQYTEELTKKKIIVQFLTSLWSIFYYLIFKN